MGAASFRYNESGLRTKKSAGGTTHDYTYNGSLLASDESGNDILYFHYDQNGEILGFTYKAKTSTGIPNGMYYYVKNLQGDVIGILNESGTLLANYAYDAWGNPLTTTSSNAALAERNPIRYRSYQYDTETGLYYVSSRYYDPEIGRWINVDSAIAQNGNLQSANMFAYCFNNPVNMADPTGNWPGLSTIFKAVAVTAAVVAVVAVCVATAGLATVAVAGGGTMVVATATTTAALGVAATAGKTALAATGAAAISEVTEKAYDNLPRNHTVYGLQDPNTLQIEYVGRTKDVSKRAAAHKRDPNRKELNLIPLATGLNAIQARGVEQILMLSYHTINTANKMNNQINGISPFNPNLGIYMEAGRGALSYLDNQISNEILYWTGY